MKKVFTRDQKVMIRRLGYAKEYRGRVVGISSDLPEGIFYIVELVDPVEGYDWKCVTIIDSCLDAEEW